MSEPTTVPGPAAALRAATTLLRDAWTLYKERFSVLIGALILPQFGTLIVLVAAAAAVMVGFSVLGEPLSVASLLNYPTWLIAGGALVLVLVMIFTAWSQASLLSAVVAAEERIDVLEASRRGWRNLPAYIWFSVISGAVMLGGFFLLIIPGILFIGWFFASPFILFAERRRGMQALLASKEYVRGRWKAVFGRVAFMIIVTMVISGVFQILLDAVRAPEAISSLFSALVLTPVSMLYYFELYRDLARSQSAPIVVPERSAGLILVAIFGALIIPALLAAAFYLTQMLGDAQGKAIKAYSGAELTRLQVELELYFSDNDRYPASLDELEGGVRNDSPATVTYTPAADGSGYQLCIAAPEQEGRCVDSNTNAWD